MPSPFPGMDPYFENSGFWHEFHGQMIFAIHAQLLDRLPKGYDEMAQEYLRLVEIPPDGEGVARRRSPDITLMNVHKSHEIPSTSSAKGGGVTTAAVLEPVTVEVPTVEAEIRERWVEIVRLPERKVVTVIELLSPANKAGDGAVEYDRKRHDLMRQRINLLEIDLLIGGNRVDPKHLLPKGDYYALLTRAGQPTKREVYAWPIRRALPTVPVPLLPGDADVKLDLAGAFAEAYERGRYHRRLAYDAPPQAPLDDVEQAWAGDLAKK